MKQVFRVGISFGSLKKIGAKCDKKNILSLKIYRYKIVLKFMCFSIHFQKLVLWNFTKILGKTLTNTG